MLQTILIFIISVLAGLLWLARRDAKRHGTRTAEEFAGICTYALDQTVRKSGNKARILALLAERGELGNTDIRKVLGISRTSAVRYMDELEREGKVIQIGKTGQAVVYRINKP